MRLPFHGMPLHFGFHGQPVKELAPFTAHASAYPLKPAEYSGTGQFQKFGHKDRPLSLP